jgi:hypothetical protein
MRDHQHIAGGNVGRHRGNQAVGVEFRKKREAFFDVVR